MQFKSLLIFVTILISVITTACFLTSEQSIKQESGPSFLAMIRDRSICSVNQMLDAVTGSLFVMDKKRTYTGPKLPKSELKAVTPSKVEGMMCDNWVVVTSVNAPTVVVKQLADSKENLCLVVVADKKSPTEYHVNRKHVVYLTVEDQMKLHYHIMDMVPWNHFARKNIGFLYAMEHGAKQIFDLDDDNELISTKDILQQVYTKEKKTFKFINTTQYVTNPYMIYLNQKGEYIWPRGYPLDAIKMPHNYTFIDEPVDSPDSKVNKIGVIQYLQNVNPDLDAIFRITSTIPPTFDESINYCVILNKKSFSPWNAQSTLFEYNSFWGMLLPMTVHGRVSDIWRSYFTQKVMWEREKLMAFCPAIVNHIRNQHRLIKDFDAEMPLYTQAEALLKFLNEWKPERTDIPGMMEDMYIEMYERGIVELKDVEFVQEWIRDLIQVGYKFE